MIKLSETYNLAVIFPYLLDEWDWEINSKLELDPYKLYPK
jgi:hypothetical protein